MVIDVVHTSFMPLDVPRSMSSGLHSEHRLRRRLPAITVSTLNTIRVDYIRSYQLHDDNPCFGARDLRRLLTYTSHVCFGVCTGKMFNHR